MKAFISFSFEDRNKFEDISYAFQRDGIEYWKVEEIAAGQSLRDKLKDAIRRCAACVFIATPRSLESGWCQAEIGAFWGAGKPVIVYLAGEQLTEENLPKQFKGDKFATSIREVVDAMKIHLDEVTESSKTDAIFGLAIEAFLVRLNLQFKTNWFLGFGTSLPGFGREAAPSLRSTNAFGEEVSYDTAKPIAEAEIELKNIIKKAAFLRKEREQRIQETLLVLFAEVQGQSQSISHYLSRIPLGDKTLAEPWNRAQEALFQMWQEKRQELICFDSHELGRLQLFLEEHPAYPQTYAEAKVSIESLLRSGSLSLDELIAETRKQLEQSMKKLIVE